MNDIKNPSPFSDYDWLEFVSFVWKVEREGYDYAEEHYAPTFEDKGLPVDGDDLYDLYERYVDEVQHWVEDIGGQRAVDLHNAHVDEELQRDRDACLWGICCEGGYIIHERTQESRDRRVAELTANRRPGWRVPVELLHRTEVGGEWTEVEPVAKAVNS